MAVQRELTPRLGDDGLSSVAPSSAGFLIPKCTNWDFESNTFDSGYGAGLHWELNNGVSGGGLTVNDNTFRGTGSSGIGLSNGGSAMGDLITNNTMTDLCKIYVAGSSEHAFCDAINLFSQTETDGGGQILITQFRR